MGGNWKIMNNSFRESDSSLCLPTAGNIAQSQREECLVGERVSLLGVEYERVTTRDGGELYLTHFGLPFRAQLLPENWYEPHWFRGRRVRLEGTSAIYKVPTKRVNGMCIELVVRFSRMGQEIPLDPGTLSENPDAEFNSPFEEFGLVMQLRGAHSRALRRRMLTKKPLAIYVPATRLEDWESGRLESKMAQKSARHPEAKLDISRPYILLYGWIKGLNAVQATQAHGIGGNAPDKFLSEITLTVIHELEALGFHVVDMKPSHVIVRVRPDGSLLRDQNGNPAYALVDYELLDRLSCSTF